MKHRNSLTAQKPEDVLDELRSLVSEAEKMLEDSVGNHAGEAVGSLRERLAGAQKRFTEIIDQGRQRVKAGAKYADETIRENPYQSLAVALGVGVLVGVFLGRRSK